jgi:hypothetical protein
MLPIQSLSSIQSRCARFFRETNIELTEHLILVRHESNGRLHCELVVYFSPQCARLARQLGASPCLAPNATGANLLIGSLVEFESLSSCPS